MKRISMIVAIALTLTPLTNVSSQTPNANSRTPQSSGRDMRPKGRVLINKLPAGAQGVTLKNGAVRLKPGYKFVKQDNGAVTVARIRGGGGLGIGGTWNCDCTTGLGAGQGTCSVTVAGIIITCLKGTCNARCELTTTIEGLKTGVIMY